MLSSYVYNVFLIRVNEELTHVNDEVLNMHTLNCLSLSDS